MFCYANPILIHVPVAKYLRKNLIYSEIIESSRRKMDKIARKYELVELYKISSFLDCNENLLISYTL